jgi:hypothetical protein
MAEPKVQTPLIFQKLVAVMSDMEALGKGRENKQQGYMFRGIDDVYNMVQPIMAKHGVIMRSTILDDRSEDRPSKSGGTLIYRVLKIRYWLVAEDGSSIDTEVIGEGMDSGDKATNKAMSVAQKYALLQMFMIPTVEPKDPEGDSPEVGKGATKSAAKPATKPPVDTTKPPVNKPADPKPETKTAGPVTDAQSDRILDLVTAFQVISGWGEMEMSSAIQKAIVKKYKVEIKGIKDMTAEMADFTIAELKRWAEAWLQKHPAPAASGDQS